MWSEDIRTNLYKELEIELDNKKFFNAKDYYSSNLKTNQSTSQKFLSSLNMTYAETFPLENSYDYENTVKGISFSNKIENPKKRKSINDLSIEDRKIYKISDLLSSNLEETIVIPYNVQSVSLALIKKIEWKDIFFSDIETAFGILKNKLNLTK